MNEYLTVQGYGEATYIIQRSRFLTYITPVETEEEAAAFISRIRKKHYDATHNCAAYTIGLNDDIQKADDDGEPSGTAGRPMLEVLKNRGLKNTCVVVTRYFGGIKLGAGGLVRAYGKAVTEGIDAAGIYRMMLYGKWHVEISYELLGTIENQLRTGGYHIADKQFTDVVVLTICAPKTAGERLVSELTDWSGGRAIVRDAGEEYTPVEFEEAE